jgi:hypothetical protein
MAVKRYNGTSWDVVAGKGDQGTSSSITTWVKTASGGETSLTGSSDSSTTLAYTPGQEQFFINGVLQVRGSDYTATNGTSITGITALVAGDIATVTSVNAFSVTGAVPLSTVTANGDLIVGTSSGAVGRLGIGSTGQLLTVSGGVPTWATPAPTTPTYVGVSLTPTGGTTSISNATWTTVNFASEIFDTNSFHDNSTNNSRITIPAGLGGKYLINMQTFWANNATGSRDARLRLNGVDVDTPQTGYTPNANNNAYSSSNVVALSVGDYIELRVRQDSGGTLSLYAANSTFFTATYLGA